MVIRNLKKPKYDIVGELERFDEADNVQTRGMRIPDSEQWRKYYDKHPELEKKDRAVAGLPPPGTVGVPRDMLMAADLRWTIGHLGTEQAVDGEPSPDRISIEPERASEKIKAFGWHLGADLMQIGPLLGQNLRPNGILN